LDWETKATKEKLGVVGLLFIFKIERIEEIRTFVNENLQLLLIEIFIRDGVGGKSGLRRDNPHSPGIISILPLSSPIDRVKARYDGKKSVKRSPRRLQLRKIESH
jgi:hypothetical protein